MSSIRVSGNTSGHYDLTVPDVAGSNTIALDKIVVADSNGFVGIGTTTAYSASTDFEVKATDPKIVINNTGQRAFGLLASGTKLYIRDESDNQDLVTITEGGNVGIGTDNPTAKLNVKSSSYPYVRITNDGYTGLDIGQADSSEGGAALIKLRDAADMDFYTADLNRMRISSTGNVGIGTGTSDPLRKLHLKDTGDVHILLQSTAAVSNGEIFEIGAGANANNRVDLTFRIRDDDGTAGNERMRITNDGDVGINTGSPASTLDVKGDLRITRNVAAGHASEGNWNFNISMEGAAQYGSLYLVPSVSTGEFSIMGDKLRVTQSSGVQIISPTSDSTSSDNVAIKYRGTAGGHKSGYLFKDKRDVVNAAVKNNLLNDGVGTAAAELQFYTSNGGTLARAMNISREGKVELDKMPNFATRVHYTGGTFGGGAIWTSWKPAHVNTGGHFNYSNGRFTAPMTGSYRFDFHTNILRSSAGVWYLDWYKNGSSAMGTQGGRIYGYWSGGWTNGCGFVVLNLAVNDYVELGNPGPDITLDGNSYGQYTGYMLCST